jgi:hypothetical protein
LNGATFPCATICLGAFGSVIVLVVAGMLAAADAFAP